MTLFGIILGVLLGAALLALPRIGGFALWKKFRSYRDRTQSEDALKHILACRHRSQLASLESLAGNLRLSPASALRLATRLQSAGWIAIGAAGIGLTKSGELRALQVVRAHRLWERHLSDDANMPMARLHQAAERAEHSLSRDEVAELDAHLGHPQHDPHGDPIPRADGKVAALDAVSLNEWPEGAPARIVHVEDEPHAVFRQILAAGLRPSVVVRVVQTDARHLRVEADGNERRIERTVAASIHVKGARSVDLLPPEATRLSDLRHGDRGQVLELGPRCRGFSRRRLLDLGLTPGATVEAALDNTFGDPRAFRIRGTLIALRKQQAEQVWIRRLPDSRTTGQGS